MNGDRAVAKHETPLQRAQEWLALTPRERAARRMQATEIITLLSDSLSAIEIGRASIHAQFRNVSRDADGNCQCAYCRGDAGQLGELAADYELRLAGETYRREAAEAALALLKTENERLRQDLEHVSKGRWSQTELEAAKYRGKALALKFGAQAAEIVELRAALALQAQPWQPMETALKDGTPILIDFSRHGVHRVFWSEEPYSVGIGGWCVTDLKYEDRPLRRYIDDDMRGWMPLPATQTASLPSAAAPVKAK